MKWKTISKSKALGRMWKSDEGYLITAQRHRGGDAGKRYYTETFEVTAPDKKPVRKAVDEYLIA